MAGKGERAEVVIAAIDKVAAPVRKINRRFDSMMAPINRVKRSVRSLSRELNLAKLGRGLASAGRMMRNVGIGAIGMGAAVFAGVNKVAKSADELGKFSRQVGLGVESLQEYEFAADRAGVGQEKFRQSIGALSKRVGELKAGKGALSTLLGSVDPEFKKRLVATEDTGEALDMILDRIDKLEDPAKKSALAAAAFSRAGLDMIRLADEGAGGIKALRMESRALGGVLSEEATRSAEETVDRLTDLKTAAGGIASKIAVELFPAVQDMAQGMTDWIVTNKDWLRLNVAEGIKTVVSEGVKFLGWIKEIAPKVASFVEKIGGFKTVAIALGVVLAASLIAPLVAVGAGIAAIVGAIGAVPALFIAAGVAVAAVGATIAAHWDAIVEKVSGIRDLVPDFLLGESEPLVAGGAALAGGPQGEAAADFSRFGGPTLAELQGNVRVEVAGAQDANVTAGFGAGIGVDLERGSNLPVE